MKTRNRALHTGLAVALLASLAAVARAQFDSAPSNVPASWGTEGQSEGVVGRYHDSGGGRLRFMYNVPIPTGYGAVVVNPNLNKIYLSGQDLQPIEVDGDTFSQTNIGNGYGDGVDVDVSKNYLWEADLYYGTASIWNSANVSVGLVSLADCPTGINVDARHRRAWVAAQCGAGNDPVWAVNADTFAIEAGPIGSGGVQGVTAVNPATGRFYLSPSSGPERINPDNSYALTPTAFGTVVGANAAANLLYAVTNGDTLQIIDGAPDPEVVLTNISLGFPVGGNIGVNPGAGRIYIGAGSSNFVSVLDAANGATLECISLGADITGINDIAVDTFRDRVYATARSSSSLYLFVIQDLARRRGLHHGHPEWPGHDRQQSDGESRSGEVASFVGGGAVIHSYR